MGGKFSKIKIYLSPTTKEFERNHSHSGKTQFFLGLNPSRSLLLIIRKSAGGGGTPIPPTPPWYLSINIWYEVETYTRSTS